MNYIVMSKSGLVYLDENNVNTYSLNNAKRFPKAGDAMRTCADVNKKLGVITFKIFPIYDSIS